MGSAANRMNPSQWSGSAVREQAEAAKEQLHDLGEQARERAQEAFSRVRESAVEYSEQGREWLVDLARATENCVRDQPVRSLLVAAGIGCLLGAIFIRR